MATNAFGVTIPEAHDIESTIDGAGTAAQNAMQFPEDLPKYYCQLDFTTYNFVGGQGGRPGGVNGTPGNTIVLPMPIGLVDKHSVRYDEKPIAPFAGAIQGAVAGFGELGLTAVRAYYGLAPNYFQTIMFDRPEYKRHELQFKLAPRNFNEALTIRDIITALNNHEAPDTWGGVGGGQGVLFRFPDIIQVRLFPNTKFLYKFKPAVITDLMVNYASEGRKAFYHDPDSGGQGDNPPESVELTIHLWEVEYWLKGQFTNTD